MQASCAINGPQNDQEETDFIAISATPHQAACYGHDHDKMTHLDVSDAA